MTETDRGQWDEAWGKAEMRTVLAPGDLEIKTGLDIGPVLSANISVAPAEYRSHMYIGSDACPLCKRLTGEEDSVVAALHPTFERLEHVSFGVRVHPECMDSLPLSSDTKPIPR